MAYRVEKTEGKNQALVFDGWEKGIAASPYPGVANIRNLTTGYYPGVAYVNYKRQAATVSQTSNTNLGPFTLTGALSGGATSATLQTTTTPEYIFLTSGTSWTVQNNWNNANNVVACIGGGGEGGINGRGGGGGGGYSQVVNLSLTPGATITYAVGLGGTGGASDGNPGGDTYFNGASLGASSAGAKGGSGGAGTGGAGGQAASGVGTTKYNGGSGGNPGAGSEGGGGGGAAGPNGAGANGVIGSGTANGGQGDNGSGGAGGTGGASPTAGSNGTEWDSTHGSGGGGGGNTDGSVAGGAGGRYGAGGGGTKKNTAGAGGDGYQGIITLTNNSVSGLWPYTTGTYSVTFSNGDVRNVTFTYGSASLTWSGGLSGSATSTINPVYAMAATAITNPLHKATSPVGNNYVLDDTGQVWKQTAPNATTWVALPDLSASAGTGGLGLAYWNNYLVVFRTDRIEFCGDGTGDAGIIPTKWNTAGTGSTVNTTSSQILAPYLWTAAVLATATSATLTSAWTGVSGSYFVRFVNAANDTRTVTFTNNSTAVNWTGGLTNDATTQFYMYQLTATNGTFSGTTLFLDNEPVYFTTTGTMPTGIAANTTYYLTTDVDLTGATVFNISATYNGLYIQPTDAETGTMTMHLLAPTSPPITNTTITASWLTPTTGIGSTTLVMSTPWLQASGNYNIIDSQGNNFLGVFTYLSIFVTLLAPAAVQPSGTFTVQIVDTTAPTHKTWVSKVDGNLYYANGRNLGRILAQNSNIKFSPSNLASYTVNFAVTLLLQPADQIVDLTDLKSSLEIAGNFDTYTWDYVSPNVSAPSPVGEQIVRMTNLLSNIYLTAGTKGNIYTSNGYSNQLLYKIPDYLSGTFDPIWSFGDLMIHRAKLWFQAEAQTPAGTNVLAGIFSLGVSPSILGEVASGLTVESQNSYGLTPATGAKTTGVLIDNERWSTGVDSYYAGWSNGASTGGIDYNDITLWDGNEAVVETDIAPIGTFLEKKSLGNIEFKLDRPMVTGDTISLYWRPSLSASYTFIKTTTDTVLSDYKQTDIATSQWAQFKATMTCASSGSSRVPIREMRVYFN